MMQLIGILELAMGPRMVRIALLILMTLVPSASTVLCQVGRSSSPPRVDLVDRLVSGWTLWRDGDLSGATEHLETLLSEYPDEPRVLVALAALLFPKTDADPRNLSRAIELGRRALELDPRSLDATRVCAVGLAIDGRVSEALDLVLPRFEELPDSFLKRLSRWVREALPSLSDRGVENRIRMAQYHEFSGRAALKLGETVMAIEHLEKAFAANPISPNVAKALLEARRRGGAPTNAPFVLKDFATSNYLEFERAQMLIEGGQQEDALELISTLKSHSKRDPRPFLLAADVFKKSGDTEKAIDELEEAILLTLSESDSSHSLALRLRMDQARLLEEVSRLDHAMDCYLWSLVRSKSEEAESAWRRLGGDTRRSRQRFDDIASEYWKDRVRFSQDKALGTSMGATRVLDINGDGRIDFYVEGEGVYFGLRSERFSKSLFTEIPCAFFDMDLDGTLELLLVEDDGLRVYSVDPREGLKKLKLMPIPDTQSPVRDSTFFGSDPGGMTSLFLLDDELALHQYSDLGLKRSRVPIDVPKGASGLTLTDLNHDGHLDAIVGGDALFGGFLIATVGKASPLIRPLHRPSNPSFLDPLPVPKTRFVAGDLDNDGDIDLLELLSDSKVDTLTIYQNRGPREYELERTQVSVRYASSPRIQEAVLADIDNDGALDILAIDQEGWLRLFIRDENVYVDVTHLSGLGNLTTKSIAVADIDDDGAQDLVLDGGRIYENSGNDNGWIKLRLEPRHRSSTMGTRVTLQAGSKSLVRECGLVKTSCGEHVSFGIGQSRGPIRAAIHWGHGRDQFIRTLKSERVHVVKEPR